MTIVEGQIETLKSLKESLSKSGITRFNSVGEIRRFINDFDFEKHHIPNKVALEFDKEIERERETLSKEKAAYDDDDSSSPGGDGILAGSSDEVLFVVTRGGGGAGAEK